MARFNEINLAISLLCTALKTTTVLHPIRHYPFLLLLPALGLTFLTNLALSALFSTASPVTIPALDIDGGHVRVFQYPSYLPFMSLPLLFGWVLLMSVLKRLAEMTNCLALCIWYFTKHKLSLLLPSKRVLRVPLRFHLGSIFKLSLLHLLFYPLRLMTQQLTVSLRRRPQHSHFTRCFSCLAQPCLSLYHNFLRYISVQSFVHVSLWGEPLLLASK